MTPRSGAPKTIGAVLAELSGDFPDVSISKIRFLEAEGLVTPHRTRSGYRTFTAEDVARLRYILTAQRDRFWPLKVIRDALDALDRGLAPPAEAGLFPGAEGATSRGSDGSGRPVVPPVADDPGLPSARELRATTALLLTGSELREASGLDQETFESLVTFGLLRPGVGDHFDANALAVARAAAALAGFGVEGRHLRAFRTAVDREVGLVEQVTSTPRGGRSSSESDHADQVAEVLRQCLALHTALVKAALSAAPRPATGAGHRGSSSRPG
ncbi:MAG: MerR family transcriptional regulator [Lapillicoccus sp.]